MPELLQTFAYALAEQGFVEAAGGPLVYLMKLAGVAVLTAFIPLTAFALPGMVARRKRAEIRAVVKAYGLRNTVAAERLRLEGLDFDDPEPEAPPSPKEDEKPQDPFGETTSGYGLPVLFTAFLCFLGSSIFIFGHELNLAKQPNMIFAGGHVGQVDQAPEAVESYQRLTVVVIGYSFIGAYLWSMSVMLRRLMAIDLRPAVYYGISLRLILAVTVAIILRHFLDAFGPALEPGRISTWGETALPVLGFFGGMLPYEALLYMRTRIAKLTGLFREDKEMKAEPFPLEMIEGISMFKKVRMAEVAVDNAQNLAFVNPLELAFRTPYHLRLLLDWVSQAQLYVAVRQQVYCTLRKAGIRTATQYVDACEDDKALQALAQETRLNPALLARVRDSLKADIAFIRAKQLRDRITAQESG